MLPVTAHAGVGDIIQWLTTITDTLKGDIGQVLSGIQKVGSLKQNLQQQITTSLMILKFTGSFGSAINLDLADKLGKRVELQCFQFVVSPVEFRLVRRGTPLQEWQEGNTEMYDLQHGPTVKEWSRSNHRFVNDQVHRNDVATCGVFSGDVVMETRGLVGEFLLLIWPRMSTCRAQYAEDGA